MVYDGNLLVVYDILGLIPHYCYIRLTYLFHSSQRNILHIQRDIYKKSKICSQNMCELTVYACTVHALLHHYGFKQGIPARTHAQLG